jgi:long-chain acyl-CoA synthetase
MSIRPLNFLRRWWRQGPASSSRTILRPAGSAAGTQPWLEQLDRAGIPRSLVYPATTLGRLVDQAADRFPTATALGYGSREWDYRQLAASVDRLARALYAMDLRPGDRILLTLPNCPEFVIAFFAAEKLGLVVINAGPLIGPDDLLTLCALAKPKAAIAMDLQTFTLQHVGQSVGIAHWIWVSLLDYQGLIDGFGYRFKLWQQPRRDVDHIQQWDFAELLESPGDAAAVFPNPDPDDLAVLQPTGGTTGTCKLAELTHRCLLANATQIATWGRFFPGQERIFTVLPLFHVYALTTCLLAGVAHAEALILFTRFDPAQLLDAIAHHPPTVFPMVPKICETLCDLIEHRGLAPPLAPACLCLSGAAALPAPSAERFQRLAGAPVIEGYGLTEASPVTHANLRGNPRPGSVGLPMPDTLIRIVDLETGQRELPPGDAGELLVCGPQLMRGYYGDSEQTQRVLSTDSRGRSWLHTGDVVRIDPDGFFYVLDRVKDVINHAGLKVYPTRVEEVLRRHPQVADVGVVGRPDATHTEIVAALIQPTESTVHRERLTRELRAYCRAHLAPYEVPAVFEYVEALPRSALGKLLRRNLRNIAPRNAEGPSKSV